MNHQAFRLMYSPESKIMTAHMIVLNPFQINEPRGKNQGQGPQVAAPNTQEDVAEQELVATLKAFTTQHQTKFYEDEPEVERESIQNRVSRQS